MTWELLANRHWENISCPTVAHLCTYESPARSTRATKRVRETQRSERYHLKRKWTWGSGWRPSGSGEHQRPRKHSYFIYYTCDPYNDLTRRGEGAVKNMRSKRYSVCDGMRGLGVGFDYDYDLDLTQQWERLVREKEKRGAPAARRRARRRRTARAHRCTALCTECPKRRTSPPARATSSCTLAKL